MSARSPQRKQLLDLLEPVVAGQGYYLEELSVTAAGRRSLIRITVDGEDGIDLDGVADVSRAISEVLDDDAPGRVEFADPYVLEVSSPGVDRPLSEPRHWRRAVGRLVDVSIVEFTAADTAAGSAADTAAGSMALVGRVVRADEAHLVLEVDGVSRQFGWPQVNIGRVQVEFSRPGDSADEPEDEEA